MWNYIKVLLVTVLMSVAVPSSASLKDAAIEQCLQNSLAQVLSGRARADEYIDFRRVTYRVFGPPARQLDDAGLQRAAQSLAAIMQSAISKERRRFQNPSITVTYVKQLARYPNAYGVEGTMSANGNYSFVVNGFFYSATQCSFHGIWIKGAQSMVQYLQEQPEVQTLCQNLTKMRC